MPRPTPHQRRTLTHAVEGLLLDGDDDPQLAARLHHRLRPLATTDPRLPFRFRRDGYAWALTVGLPYTPGADILMPCRTSACPTRFRCRPTFRILCDQCATEARTSPAEARRAILTALEAPLPGPDVEYPTLQLACAPGAPPQLPAVVRAQLNALRDHSPKAAQIGETVARDLYAPPTDKETPDQARTRKSRASARWCALTTRYARHLTAGLTESSV